MEHRGNLVALIAEHWYFRAIPALQRAPGVVADTAPTKEAQRQD
jgi:hypothetical protein